MVRMEWDGGESVHVRMYLFTLYILVQQSKSPKCRRANLFPQTVMQ